MKNKFPKISIISVVLNGEGYIEDTIKSVINQTYPNIEYIIIDGGSTDNTVNIIKKYEKNINKFISEEDGGVYDAINKGIKISSGNILHIINCGDVYFNRNSVLDVMNEFVRKSDISFVVTRVKYLDSYGKEYRALGGSTLTSSLVAGRINQMDHQSFFYKKELHKRFGLYEIMYKVHADAMFMYSVYRSRDIKRCLLDKVVVLRRKGGLSNKPEALLELRKVYNRIFGKSLINDLLLLKYYLKRNEIGGIIYKVYEEIKLVLHRLVKSNHY